MPRATNTAERRAEIVDALIAVMAKRGYDGASIAEVARRARLTPGLVHYHFDNKLEILVEAVRVLGARHAQGLETALAAHADPLAQLAAFVDVHLGLGAAANPEALACWVLVCAEALRERRIRGEVERVLAGLTGRLAGILRSGHAARRLACPDPEAAAAALVATIHGYFTVAAIARDAIPSGTAARCTLRMAEGLVRPKRPLRLPKEASR